MKGSWVILFFYCLLTTNELVADKLVPFGPFIPKPNSENCVRETEFMKKNHMELLFEQRDLVVLKGIRSKTDNFNRCLSCHAIKNSSGSSISYNNPKHFCRNCHDFAAVKIDCFDCHSSVPDENIINEASSER